MSIHKIPLTELEQVGLTKHGLPIGKPSQLSDVFRHGVKWALDNVNAVPVDNKEILQSLRDMVEIVGANFCSNQDVKRKYKIARELLEKCK